MLRASHAPAVGARIALALAVLFSLSSLCSAQLFDWTQAGAGTGWKHGHGITMDALGNVFSVGKVAAQPTSQANASAALVAFGGQNPLTVLGVGDAFVVWYSTAGAFQSTLQFKSSAGALVTATGVANADNVLYVTGEIAGRVDFGNNVSVTAPSRSSYIARIEYTPAPMRVQWVKLLTPQSANSGTVRTTAIAVSGSDLYVTGEINGLVRAQNMPPPSSLDASVASTSLFVARYTTAGYAASLDVLTPLVVGANPASVSYGASIAARPYGTSGSRAIVTGTYRGSIQRGSTTLAGSPDRDNLVVASITSDHTGEWLNGTTSAAGAITGRGIAMNSLGDAYVTGDVRGTVTLPNSIGDLAPVALRDLYIVTVDRASGAIMKKMVGGAAAASEAFGNAIAVHEDGTSRQIIVAGALAGTITEGSVSVTSMGNHDVLLARIDQNAAGTFLPKWMRRAGNSLSASEQTNQDQGMGLTMLAATSDDRIYMIGEFGGDAEFYPNADVSGAHPRNVFTSGISQGASYVQGRITYGPQAVPSPRHRVTLTQPSSGAGIDEALTDATGSFTLYAKPSGSYQVAAASMPRTTASVAGQSTSYFAGSGATRSADILFTTTDTVPDLRIEITPLGAGYAVPDNRRYYHIYYKNHGTATYTHGAVITMAPDALLTNPATIITSGPVQTLGPPVATWTFSGAIPPMGAGDIIVAFDFDQLDSGVVPQISSGTVLHSTISITGALASGPVTEGGTYGADNFSSIDDDVFFPLDPNIKTSIPKGNLDVAQVRAGMDLEYTIDFYNLGPNRAQIVNVLDLLDDDFFMEPMQSEFHLIDFSPALPAIPYTKAGFLLKFPFENADLLGMPQSVADSRGFLRFTSRLRTDLPVGTVITNYADIQFDAQKWFRTNVAKNCVEAGFAVTDPCVGATTQFLTQPSSIAAYIPDSSTNVQWSFGDASTGSGFNTTHQYAAAGTYTVIMSFDYPGTICDSPAVGGVHTVTRTITISTPPAASNVVRSGDTLIADSAAAYQWYRNDSVLVGATARRHVMTTAGAYAVEVFNAGGCGSTSQPVGIRAEESSLGSVAIAPNPGTGRFRMLLARPAPRDIVVGIYDALGSSVGRVRLDRGATSCMIDLASSPAGTYTASFELDGRVIARTFVLRR
jgi:hypothetical protein